MWFVVSICLYQGAMSLIVDRYKILSGNIKQLSKTDNINLREVSYGVIATSG